MLNYIIQLSGEYGMQASGGSARITCISNSFDETNEKEFQLAVLKGKGRPRS
jgi:hypothetical protein